jgi:hypothetical protein
MHGSSDFISGKSPAAWGGPLQQKLNLLQGTELTGHPASDFAG